MGGVVVKNDLCCYTIVRESPLPYLSGSVATVGNLGDCVELLQRALVCNEVAIVGALATLSLSSISVGCV